MEKIIYFAAPMFNLGDLSFNVFLNDKLEEKGFRTFFPQRDGFEFGGLTKELESYLQGDDILEAVKNIIWTLDVGVFIKNSDAVLARCDEPLDPGVDVELGVARFGYNKSIVGYRTDVRSPYITGKKTFGGMHTFPGMLMDEFINYFPDWKITGPGKLELAVNSLVNEIVPALRTSLKKIKPNVDSLVVSRIESVAQLLFEGMDVSYNSEGNVQRVAQRYAENIEDIRRVYDTEFI
ncbi:hypothetical protein HN832_04815 [archaeon]|nr:hypothetical protein [archaeon]MBT4374009.1 hypothetical protein [archaeon]MBT4532105.1 hypothetical protein [archaeon]MBT7001995.1 hypothetical protein [archaeon]MBT7282706.1 hypothetical protein [archaeon]